ncbi:MAG: hypothetical protein KGH65_04210 [Candidatus Micrarchaeota archaeon]|nr:hypothetical protein [Candidatus Micrarchaeota archaeon]
MTLIINLNCKEGIVMASDSQAVALSSNSVPIKYDIQKIYKIGKHTLFGASGAISLIQRTEEILQSFKAEFDKGLTTGLRERIKSELFPILKKASEDHKNYHHSADGMPTINILISTMDSNRNYRTWHIAKDCNDEFLEKVGYTASGNGDLFAYTLLKNYTPKQLELKKGVLVAYRIMKDAIAVSAFGLSEPIDIWTLKDGKIENLDKGQIAELNERYLDWKIKEAEVLNLQMAV